MKKLALICTLALAAKIASAQGVVNFANASTLFQNTTRLLRWSDDQQPGLPVPGTVETLGLTAGGLVSSNLFPTLRAQLYWGASTATSFSELTTVTSEPSTFRSTTTPNAGAWV